MADDLVKRLRALGDHASFEPHMHHIAADRIEELEAKLDWMIVKLDWVIAERDETFALMLDRAKAVDVDLIEQCIRDVLEEGGTYRDASEYVARALVELAGGNE